MSEPTFSEACENFIALSRNQLIAALTLGAQHEPDPVKRQAYENELRCEIENRKAA